MRRHATDVPTAGQWLERKGYERVTAYFPTEADERLPWRLPQAPALKLNAGDPCWGCGQAIGAHRIGLLCAACMHVCVESAAAGEAVGLAMASELRPTVRVRPRKIRRVRPPRGKRHAA